MFVGKKEAREICNQIDKVVLEIKDIQSSIDRTSDKIDNELNSCGRELMNAQTTLKEIKPLVESLVNQVGSNAPDHIKVLVGTIADSIMGKVNNTLNNLAEVQKNVKDVDKLTDEIDNLTDSINRKLAEIDAITDKMQK